MRMIPAAMIVVLAGISAASAQTLKREPPMGQLKPGQTVLVDDGSCRKGQIKQAVGGDHVKVGGRAQTVRTEAACRDDEMPRPSALNRVFVRAL